VRERGDMGLFGVTCRCVCMWGGRAFQIERVGEVRGVWTCILGHDTTARSIQNREYPQCYYLLHPQSTLHLHIPPDPTSGVYQNHP
jgi:hypothetical protein